MSEWEIFQNVASWLRVIENYGFWERIWNGSGYCRGKVIILVVYCDCQVDTWQMLPSNRTRFYVVIPLNRFWRHASCREKGCRCVFTSLSLIFNKKLNSVLALYAPYNMARRDSICSAFRTGINPADCVISLISIVLCRVAKSRVK